MPQPKRRKLSLDEQDGKERDKNRIASGPDEGIDKPSGNAAALAKEGCGLQAQPDKRTSQSKSERKAEGTTQALSSMVSSVEEGRDGAATSSVFGDGCERVSSSGRVIRQTNKGRCFTAALEAAQNKQSTATGQGVGNAAVSGQPSSRSSVGKSTTPIRRKRGRKRRSWDLWSKFEQDAFFEGLFEHGKDFDAIHNLLVFRSKKRGIETSLIKTKEQVRYLYYRMWQKISKHVEMGNNVKKEAQEIYGLVNYYVIRKVFKRMDERAVEHLNELILKGVSKVREPNATGGKKNRKKLRVLRTPVCNALKKLNNIEDSKEEFVAEMPQQVMVELTPRSSAAWLKVHNLSHNPRVRFQVSVNRSLASLLEYLKKKWKGPNDRLRSSLGETEEGDELVVYPHHTYSLKPVTLAPQRATSVDLITFSSYRDNVLGSPPAGSRSAKKGSEDPKQASDILSDADGLTAADCPKRSRSGKKSTEDPKSGDVLSDGDGLTPTEQPKPPATDHPKPVKSSVKINLLPKLSDPVVQMPQPPCEDENAMFPDAPLFSPPARDDVGSTGECNTMEASWATNSTCDSEEQKAADPSPDTSPQSKERSRDWREEERTMDMRRLVESATRGFTRQACRLVTLARLSLMLGKTNHIRLEYDWRPRWSAGGGGGGGASTSILGDVERLTNMLRRLSSLANLEYRDLMQRAKMSGGGKMSQCTLCGHSLDKATTRKKMTCEVATETDPLTEEVLGRVSVMQPAQLNSNGTLVGVASKSSFLNPPQTPDTDGVFRVPMPIAVPMSIRADSPQKLSTQPTVGQINRPPESQTSRLSSLAPYKRRPRRKPVVCQRTLLPKMPGSPLILVPHNVLQPLPGVTTPVQAPQPLPSAVPQGVLQTVQPMTQQTEVAMGDGAVSSAVISESSTVTTAVSSSVVCLSSAVTTTVSSSVASVSSTVSTVSSRLEEDNGAPLMSVGNLIGENSVSSSDLFACNLDMPVIVSPNPSPVKSTQQLISSSVSPPTLSSMFDISLPAPSNQAPDTGDKFLEMVSDGNSGFSGLLKSPLKVECGLSEAGSQGVGNVAQHALGTPQHVMHTPTHALGSPSQRSPLKSGAETQWLGGEVPDLSLSEFEDSPVKKSTLGENSNSVDLQAHSLSLSRFLQSPEKKLDALEGPGVAMPTLSVPSTSAGGLSSSSFIPAPPSLFGESSQDSLVARLDVDTALQSMMMESSIDYSSKFEKLAEHLADNTDASQPNL